MITLKKPLTILLAIAIGGATAKAVHKENWPHVRPPEVNAYLDAHRSHWEQQISKGGMRLFYTDKQWEKLSTDLVKNEGLRPGLYHNFISLADSIAAMPTRHYTTPEQETEKTGQSIYATEEELWQRRVGDNIFAMAVAAKLSDKPAYKAKLRDLVLEGCRYPHWGRRNRNNDLAAGHMARGIALAWDWHRDLFDKEEQAFIRDTIATRVLEIQRALYGTKFWARSYAENHNHVSVAALGFVGLAFYNDIPLAPEWLAAACVNFNYVAHYSSADGSSDEGVSYWTYGASFILQFIEATGNVTTSRELYQKPFLQNGASYRIGSSTPGFHGTLPWGDAVKRDYYGPHHILARLAAQYNDHGAQYLLQHIPFPPQGGNDVPTLQMLWYTPEVSMEAPDFLDYHADVWDVVTTRNDWGQDAYMLSLKSGFNNRNHSHLDAGALALIIGQDWLLQASGYGNGYGNNKFWQRAGGRWEYFSNATESHSTLLIDGKNQLFDSDTRSTIDQFVSIGDYCWASVDLSGVYEGERAVRRSLLHRRDDYILVFDSVLSAAPARVEWLAQVPGTDLAVEPRRLTSFGKSGKLAIHLLNPQAGDFARRMPTSPHVDQPADRTMQSYSSAQEGSSVGFVTLLQPILPGKNQHEFSLKGELDGQGFGLAVVDAGQWQDSVFIAPEPQDVHWRASGGQHQSVSLIAALAVIRETKAGLQSVFAVRALRLKVADIALESSEPVSFSLQIDRASDSTLTFATEFSGTLHLNGARLTNADGQPVPAREGERLSLPAGQYHISSGAAASQ